MAKIDSRLQTLESFLEHARCHDVKDAKSYKHTYIKCGMPYFKDALFYPAPENQDYKHRKNVLKEMFPFDLPSANVKWKTKEKVDLVNGIKNQMVDYIKLQQSKKICQEKKTRGKMQKLRFISHNQDLNEMTISNLYETIQNDYPDFQINWNLVSFNDLQSTHTVTECMGMWYSYLRPDINRAPFTEEENAILVHLAQEYNYQNWHEIAQQLDRRTSLQTYSYFASELTQICPQNVRWTPEEDTLLLDAIKKFKTGSTILWSRIGTMIPNRNKTQCYNRYLVMNRNIQTKKGVFSPQENRILLNYVAKYGADFSKMPHDLLPDRSIPQIKNHYNVALKHKGTVYPWTHEEDKQLMEFVKKEGTNNWRKIADMLGTHNRLSCRTRYLTISKFLAKNPKKTIDDVPSRLKTVTSVHRAMEESDEEVEAKSINVNNGAFGKLSSEVFKIKFSQLYNMMRTAYGYTLNVQGINIDTSMFLMLKSLLGIQHYGLQRKFSYAFTNTQYSKLNSALASELDNDLLLEIIQAKRVSRFMVPLNFYTAVGLRSVAVKVHEDPVEETERPSDTTEEYKAALKTFQEMFVSLFYWPAMLSKLDRKELISMKATDEIKDDIKPKPFGNMVLKRETSQKVYGSTKKIKLLPKKS